jgi:hypothetical protein
MIAWLRAKKSACTKSFTVLVRAADLEKLSRLGTAKPMTMATMLKATSNSTRATPVE